MLALVPAGAASARPVPPAQTAKSRAAAAEPCIASYRQVKAQGLSCPTDVGLWKVKLPNGALILTHGPDRTRAASGPGDNGQHGIVSPDVVPRNPVCASSNAYHAVMAVPSDAAIPTDAERDAFRQKLRQADGILYQAAVESGSPSGAHFRMVCNADGSVRVDAVKLSPGQPTFGTIVSDLQHTGYKSASLKYAVYYTRPLGAFAGQGSLNASDVDSAANINNQGPDYAVNYNSTTEVMLHEMGHTVGAVQPGAPYATGFNETDGNGFHCFQDYDVMCYNDGGSTDPGTLEDTCDVGVIDSFDHFDCGHDSYYDAQIGVDQGVSAGSWLDQHWNIGDCYVVFLENAVCATGLGPANDDVGSATSVAGPPFAASNIDTADASIQTGEPQPSCAAAGKTVWYRFTPTRAMRLRADTLGHGGSADSNFDTVLAVYDGASLDALDPPVCSDDIPDPGGNQRSRVEFTATAGHTYYFQVGGFDSAGTVRSGLLSFGLTAIGDQPANDDFAAASSGDLPIDDTSTVTDGATAEATEPVPSCGLAGKTVWYRITPTPGQLVVADTVGAGPAPSDFDTMLAVYRGTSLGGLTEVGCSDDISPGNPRSRIRFTATPGDPYYVQVGGYRRAGVAADEADSGRLSVRVFAAAPPANDDFAAATPIAGFPFSSSVTTLAATEEPAEPQPLCSTVGATAWYRFAPSKRTAVTVDTEGSDFDTVLAAYQGTAAATLAPLACDDDVGAGERVQFEALAGQTYYVQAGGYRPATEAATGTLQVHATATVRPDPPGANPPDPVPPGPLPTPTAKVSLVSSRLAVDRRGRARVRLRCAALFGASRCTGRLSLTRGKRTLGKAAYRIGDARSKTVLVRLPRTTRRTLARGAGVRAVLHLRTTLAGEVVQSATRKVRLRR
jgi:hypothetical protein